TTKKELEKKLKSAKAGTAKSYYRKLIKEIEKSIKELQKSAADYANTAVPKDYMENAADIFKQMQQGAAMRPPEAFRQLHTDAIYDLRREMVTQIEQGIAKAKQQTEKLVSEAHEIAQKTALRNIALDAAQNKIDNVGTVTDMQQEVVKKLEETGILKVEVGSGDHKREMSITNYAHLVARSVSREVGNTARINQMSANGFDLVEIPTHYPTCEICAILQDRVYSISGNDKRFPPLSKAIGEYKNIHPHCRHVIVGWAEMMYTPEEIEEAIKKSNRPWTDPRSGEEKQFYNELQKKNRQARDLQYQYERYKKRLGSDAPKSLYAFKRIKKAGGEKWEELQKKYREQGIDKSVSKKYNKYIGLPPEIEKISVMTKEIKEEISKAFDKLSTQYDLPISSSDIKCESFGKGNEKCPFRFSPCKIGYSYRPSIEINSDYY
ncbi:MAG: phage minor capsid protein, partial [Ruminiclostridium sp.]|nr:phage minor capsid protein [Ruminiclostridium sp.]